MRPLVSILIPAYNAEKWIGEAIASALAQTWPQKEIIVVDDGSTDGTFSAAQRVGSGVTVVRQQNGGASAARNHALRLCQGSYIQWLDADDLLAPDKIERQMQHALTLDDPRVLLSSAWGCFFWRPHRTRLIPSSLWADMSPVEWMVRKMENNAWMSIESWLISRALTELAGPWNEQLMRDNDGEYLSRVLCASRAVKFVPEAHSYVRRSNDGSLSNDYSVSPAKLESILESITLKIKYLRRLEDSARVRQACLKELQQWIIFFYPEQPQLLDRAEALAHVLGGTLAEPELDWKYRMIKNLLGWSATKKTKSILPKIRSSLVATWDRVLSLIDRKGPAWDASSERPLLGLAKP